MGCSSSNILLCGSKNKREFQQVKNPIRILNANYKFNANIDSNEDNNNKNSFKSDSSFNKNSIKRVTFDIKHDIKQPITKKQTNRQILKEADYSYLKNETAISEAEILNLYKHYYKIATLKLGLKKSQFIDFYISTRPEPKERLSKITPHLFFAFDLGL